MRLAFITHEPFYPPSGGGSAEAIYLVQELVKRQHQVHIFCPKVSDPEQVRQQFGVELHEFRTWQMGRYTTLRNFKYILYPFFLQRMVETHARKLAFDLVLSQHAISAVAAGRLKARLRIPVVMNFLDYLTGFMEAWPPYLAPPPLLKRLKKFELSLPLKYRANAVLTVSDTLADYFAESGFPRERIRPIYYGFDADLFLFAGRTPSDALATTAMAVMHGSFDHHHLRAIALEAIEHVVRMKPQVVFKFVGHQTPALQTFLQQVNARVPSARIETTGFVPYREVSRHLADATVGIVPYEESTGTHCAFVAKIVEYLALGLPVVSTPLKSAVRYFRNEPMIRFSEFSGASFGECILSWLREPAEARHSLARGASERVRSALDWPTISRNAVDFVERVYDSTDR